MYSSAERHEDHPIYISVLTELRRCSKHPLCPKQLRGRLGAIIGLTLYQDVLANPWFERMWTLQEGALARDLVVQSGSRVVLWRRFVGAFRIISNIKTVTYIPLKNYLSVEVIEFLRHTWYTLDGPEIDLMSMLKFCRPREASDMRDKVYGLLGLYTPWSVVYMPSRDEPTIEPNSGECVAYTDYYTQFRSLSPTGPKIPAVDYSKSIEHVYIDVALACLSSGKLDILKDCCAYEEIPPPGTEIYSGLHGHYVSKNPPMKHALPSWVSDWSIGAEGDCMSPLVDDLRTKEQLYFASKDHHAEANVLFEKNSTDPTPLATLIQSTTIGLKGLLFDRVTDVVPTVHTYANMSSPSSRNTWASWASLALRDADSGPYTDRNGCIDALWRTVIADKPDDLSTCRAEASLGANFDAALTGAILGGDLPPGHVSRYSPLSGSIYFFDHNTSSTSWAHPREGEITEEEYTRYSKPLMNWLTTHGNRHLKCKLFRTRRGYIGMSCMHVEPGDQVAVFWGGRLPFLLREMRGGKPVKLVASSDLQKQQLDAKRVIETQTYELVGGECYIHGLAEGQALDVAQEEGTVAGKIYVQ